MLGVIRKNPVFFILLAVVVFVAAFLLIFPQIGNPPAATDQNKAKFTCEFLCKGELSKGRNLSEGPCLSAEIGDAWELSGWVCDIAHFPRIPSDELQSNQCPEYGTTATHFVEFTPECQFIRAV